MLKVASGTENTTERGARGRRKSMDPVSEYIHLEELPNPGCRFELLEILGTGTSSKVYLAIDKQKGNRVAVKVISNIAESLMEIESEYRVLSSVGGQSLIPEFHGAYLHSPNESTKELWFVMELCEGVPVSTLLKWLKSEGHLLKENEIAALLKTFMTVIYHLHENEIIHRDIRASNFILSPEGVVKLIDFGTCALAKHTEGKAYSSIGAPYWMAPEVIACEQMRSYTKACDVWSLGITAMELAETQPPLHEIHPVCAMFQIARNPPPAFKKIAEWSESFKDFVSECLVKNPEHRPCIAELIFHPFITDVDPVEQNLTLEEHLQQKFVPVIGDKATKILEKLGNIVREHLCPAAGYVPLSPVVKNWYLKTDPDLPYVRLLPDDLASLENPNEESAIDLLYQRFIQDEIYTYIGDVLIAINPRKEVPLYSIKTEINYWEKARSDNHPHVFAVADRAYQQMLHHKRSQVAILLGEKCSGKSFSAMHLINHLAFLSPHSQSGMADKIQQLCPLLDAFGNAQVGMNQNASRHLKTVAVTFTKTGKITGAILHAALLDTTVVTRASQNECNFHVFYYVYEGLKSENKLKNYYLDKLVECRYLPRKNCKNNAEMLSGYKFVISALRICSFSEEEITTIISVIAAILLLGDVKLVKKGDMVVLENPNILQAVAKNLSVNVQKLESVFKNETDIIKLEKKRNNCVRSLYAALFAWITSMLNRQLSFSRLVFGESFSVSVIDPPGFQNADKNQIFHLCSNIINDYLQNFIQQLMFFKELGEYKEEEVDIPFKCGNSFVQGMKLSSLIDSQKHLLEILSKASRTPGNEKTNQIDLKSASKEKYVEVEKNKVRLHHIFGKVCYDGLDLIETNIDICPADFLTTFEDSKSKTILGIADKVQIESNCKTDELQNLFSKLLEIITEDFPHIMININPTPLSTASETTFDRSYVLKQFQIYNLAETIFLRQQGYARRLTFSEFLHRYKYLAFDFDEEVEVTKDNCRLLLLRLKMDGWKIGKNKVFLKYYAEEYLSRLYEIHVKKIVKVQAMARRFIVKARQGKTA